MSMIAIVGAKGKGKSSLVAKIVKDRYKEQFKHGCQPAENFVEMLNAGGYKNLKIEYPLVFSNFTIKRKYRGKKIINWDFNPFRFGIPNEQYETDILVPYGLYIIDETHFYINDKNWQDLPKAFFDACSTSRHWNIDIFFITQSYKKLPSDIRKLIDEVWVIDNLKTIEIPIFHYPIFQRWYVVCYYEGDFEKISSRPLTRLAMRHLRSTGQDYCLSYNAVYTNWGNIWKNYNDKEMMMKWLRNLDVNSQFTYRKNNADIFPDIYNVALYNSTHIDLPPRSWGMKRKELYEKYGDKILYLIWKPYLSYIFWEEIEYQKKYLKLTYTLS